MQIRYLGPLGLVRLESGARLPRGEAVEVPDALATELVSTRPAEFEAVAVPKRKKGDD